MNEEELRDAYLAVIAQKTVWTEIVQAAKREPPETFVRVITNLALALDNVPEEQWVRWAFSEPLGNVWAALDRSEYAFKIAHGIR